MARRAQLASGVLIIAILAALAPSARGASGDDLTQADLEAAISRMKTWLYQQQAADGSWETTALVEKYPSHYPRGGQTAAVVYALLSAGESFQRPEIRRGLDYLRQAEIDGTYAMSLRTHVWALLPPAISQSLLERDGQWLAAAHSHGLYDYTNPPRKGNTDVGSATININYSLSRTQYGVLGIWELAKRGASIPDDFWRDVRGWMLAIQHSAGGWNYGLGTNRSDTPPDGGMTSAGLTLLYVSRHYLERKADVANDDVAQAIERGLAWLDKHYKGSPITSRDANWSGMYWYGIERIGLAGGIREIGGLDWFRSGAAWILKNENGGRVNQGSGGYNATVNTAFCLMFLARGNVPIWVNKLEIPEYGWNNRPNDIYFLSKYLSTYREHELGWQVVGIDEQPRDWLNAPILYLSGRDPLELTDAQAANLKTYLDLGGLLWVNPERSSRGFIDSVRALGQQLYPELGEMKAIGADHPLMTVVPRNDARPMPVLSLNNGARDLILVPQRDWAMEWQSDTTPGRGEPWEAAVSLFAMATDRGSMRSRLDSPNTQRVQREATGTIKLARVALDSQPVLEPEAYTFLADELYNRTGKQLEVVTLKPAELTGDIALAHLGGVDPVELQPNELAGLVGFVKGGGTLVVDTVAGRGEFAPDLEIKLAEALGSRPGRLIRSPIETGQGLTGGRNVDRLATRPFSLIARGTLNRLAMSQLEVDGRPGVLISGQDLTLGILGVNRWGINGYAPETTRALMHNLILLAEANRQK